MLHSISTFILFVAVLSLGATNAAASKHPHSGQLVVVLADSWDSPSATLYAFERQQGRWQLTWGPWSAVIGKKGMGWGIGQGQGEDGPRKREGDGKAPAGRFSLLNLMGYAETTPSQMIFPYRPITAATRCIDDSASPLYNQIVEVDRLPPEKITWNSAETMRRKDDLYKWLIVTGYNQPDPQPQQGSCIFIHIWRSPERGTAGCTALEETNLLRLMSWLSDDKGPQLLQLPRQVFASKPDYSEIWQLLTRP